nr:T9SS type A sorting domain-containing protein [Saprospiraceae bacterium]
EPIKHDGWEVFPNPAANAVNIRIDGAAGQEYTLSLFTADGRLLRSYAFEGATFQFQREGWPAGLYYLQLISEKQGAVKQIVMR